MALDLVELLADGSLILRRQLSHLIAHDAERRLEGVGQIAGVGSRPLQQLAVVVQQPVDILHQRLDLQRIAQPEPLLMTLVNPPQFAAQQVQRPQAVDDLEHEAEHQTGGGKAETEEQADAGLVEGLGQGAAVLGHHQSEHPIRTGQQHGTGHD